MRLCAWRLLVFIFIIFFPAISFAQSIDIVAPKGKGPINISSLRLEYFRREDLYRFDGSVVISHDKFLLKADHVDFDNRSGRVKAEGNVEVFDGENQLNGKRIEFDINTKTGIVYTGNLLIRKENYYIEGEVMEKLDDLRYHLINGFFTSCELKQGLAPDWHFGAREMDLNTDDYLAAKGVTFYVKEIPIMYIPYFIYPAKRRSGFLMPRTAYSTVEGLKINEGFYWVIADNHDATISFDYRSQKGKGVDLEYRYLLHKQAGGRLEVDYLRDMEIKSNRIDLKFNHSQAITNDLQVKVDARYLSDPSIFRDLSELTEERVQRSIESNAFMTNRSTNSFLYILGRYSKVLGTEDSQVPQKIPEIGYSIIEKRTPFLPLFYSINMTGSNISVKDGVDLQRYDLHSRLGLRIDLSNLLILTPSADLRETIYSREEVSNDATGREIYRLALDAKTKIFKDLKFSDNLRIRHIIEPSGIYEYVPDVDQKGIPIIDDIDNIPAKDLITYSLINRFIARYMVGEGGEARRLEFLYFKATQSYKRDEPSPLSDLRLEAVIRPYTDLSIDIDSFYNPYEGRLSSFNSDLKIMFTGYLRFAIGQRYTKEGKISKKGDIFNPSSLGETIDTPEIRFLTWQVELGLMGGITIGNTAYYDLLNERFSEINYGVRYDAGCWFFSLTYADLPQKNQVSFLFGLKGVGVLESGSFGDMFK